MVIMSAILFNSLWIMLEKFCFAGGGIISAMYVARYLGPEDFGTFSYLLSIVILIMPFIQLGSDNILFNRIAKNQQSGMRLMVASLRLKFILFMVFSCGLMFWAGTRLPFEQTKILALLLLSTFFTIHDIYKLFYDATLASKVNLLINNCALVVFIGLNLTFVHYQMSLVWFALSYVFARSLLPFVIRRILFSQTQRFSGASIKKTLTVDHLKKYNLYLLKVGFPLAISSLAIVIYTRIDQIMLAKFIGNHAVGIYSAALSISQGWIIVPLALITSFMTMVVSTKSSKQSTDLIRLLYLITVVLFIPIILLVGLFSDQIIALIYGEAFHETASILLICSLTSLCSVLGTIAYRVIIMHSGYRFVAIKMPIVALINIVLNYHFIPRYGVTGAAWATLFSEVASLFFLNALFKKGLVTQQLICAYKSIPVFVIEVKNYVKSNR